MTEVESGRNPVEELAEEFLKRYRAGEHPAVSEYARRYPDLAGEINDLFPALVMMEAAGPRAHDQAAPFQGRITADGEPLRQLGSYRILREVGRGGMGIVYEAEQEALGRHVALKILPFEAAANRTCLMRFSREARATARLHHTNIVPVHDVGEHEGVHYFAMQFIQGQSLDEVIAALRRLGRVKKGSEAAALRTSSLDLRSKVDGPSANLENQSAQSLAGSLVSGQFSGPELEADVARSSGHATTGADGATSQPEEVRPFSFDLRPSAADRRPNLEARPVSVRVESSSELATPSTEPYYRSVARVGLQVAEALAYAHGQKVLHRDIKPSNLLLDVRGTVWVVDFGLAKDEGDDLSKTGDVVGTLRYLAPERFKGESDARGDIYSLGLTLYELLTLRPAFEQTDRSRLIQAITQQEPARPRRLDRRMPRDLETIVLKAVAKEPHHRYQAAESLVEDLRCFLADLPIRARRITPAEQMWRWCRRNPGWAATLGTVGLLLIVILIGGTFLNFHLQNALKRTQEAERDQEEKLWQAHLERARALRMSGRIGQRFEVLRTVKEAASIRVSPELKDEAAAALVRPDVELVREWKGCTEDTIDVAFDGAFHRYVTLHTNGSLAVWRLGDDGAELVVRLPSHGLAPFHRLWMSPDGCFVAYGHNRIRQGIAGGLRVWRVDGPLPVVVLDECAGVRESALAFDATGRYLAVGHPDRSVSVYEADNGRRVQRFPLKVAAQIVAFHPRDDRLAVACGNAVRIFEVRSGKEVQELRHPKGVAWISGLAWHPDGRRLATAADDSLIHIWDAAHGVEVMTPWAEHGIGTVIAFNHVGDRLISSGWSGRTSVWDVETGQSLLTSLSSIGLNFSSDDQVLGFRSQGANLQLWRLAPARELYMMRRRHSDGLEHFYAPALLHDGSVVAATCQNSSDSLTIWMNFFDFATGEELASVPLNNKEDNEIRLFSSTNGFFTAGTGGLLFWPIRSIAATSPDHHLEGKAAERGGLAGDVLQVGPPRRLAPTMTFAGLGVSQGNNVLALPQKNGAVVLNRSVPGRQTFLGPQYDVRNCAVSPDGRWAVTCSHWWDGRASTARIWDAKSGRLVHDLLLKGSCTPGFSPDGRWLGVTEGEMHLWEVETWKEKLRLPGGRFAFSPDSRLIALGDVPATIRLLDLQSGREIARLTGPEATWYFPESFSRDGTRLIATDAGDKAIYVWDLRAIRAELKSMELDWDWPEFPPATESGASRSMVAVKVDPGFLRQTK
jgi:serine/threonine protein kinase/WD40 repeat protein